MKIMLEVRKHVVAAGCALGLLVAAVIFMAAAAPTTKNTYLSVQVFSAETMTTPQQGSAAFPDHPPVRLAVVVSDPTGTPLPRTFAVHVVVIDEPIPNIDAIAAFLGISTAGVCHYQIVDEPNTLLGSLNTVVVSINIPVSPTPGGLSPCFLLTGDYRVSATVSGGGRSGIGAGIIHVTDVDAGVTAPILF